MISASMPFAHTHRHFSHLLMIYPLYIMTPEQPENRELVIKSLKHWMSMPQQLKGYSFTGAASISALLGEGNEALRYLHRLLDFRAGRSQHDVHGGRPVHRNAAGRRRVAQRHAAEQLGRPDSRVPRRSHGLEGRAFSTTSAPKERSLVSAARKDGKTQWVRVKSLAGERCRIRPGLEGEVKATVPLKVAG